MSEWKETEIGDIPKQWDIVNFSDFIDIKSGQVKPHKKPYSQMIHVGSENIESNNGRLLNLKTNEECNVKSGNYLFTEEDILYSKIRPYFNKVASPCFQGTCSADIYPVRPRDKTKFDKKFLFYFLLSNFFLHQAISSQARTGIPKINREQLGIIRLIKPPIEEQKAIADVLSCLDGKIENLRRQNETLEAIAQTLFKHWFMDFEFPNEDGKPYKSSGGAMIPSELGEIPEGWRVGTLGEVVDINKNSINQKYSHSIIEYVDISSVGTGILEGTTQYELKNAPSRAKRLVQHGDVIWSGVRPNRKSYLFISHPLENLVISTGFITLSAKLIPFSYLYNWVTTESFVDYLKFNASGSAYPAVKAEHFKIAEILIASEVILANFHELVNPMREKIHQNYHQIQTLTKTRDTLLPKLMSGQLRVKEQKL